MGLTPHYYYALILCNILTPQLLWFEKVRRNVAALFVMSLVINTGMWLERFVIVVISLTRDFMPSAWGRYPPRSGITARLSERWACSSC